MKLLLDFLPILIFFGVYKATGNLITATAVLIPVTIVQVGVVYWLTKKLEKMALVTLVLVIILGGLTVLLNDGWFIMWKPTVVNWLFAAAFLEVISSVTNRSSNACLAMQLHSGLGNGFHSHLRGSPSSLFQVF